MPITTRNLLDQYTEILQKIYGKHLKKGEFCMVLMQEVITGMIQI